jgi:hypothetical protein
MAEHARREASYRTRRGSREMRLLAGPRVAVPTDIFLRAKAPPVRSKLTRRKRRS